jgi:hypothetical protein
MLRVVEDENLLPNYRHFTGFELSFRFNCEWMINGETAAAAPDLVLFSVYLALPSPA